MVQTRSQRTITIQSLPRELLSLCLEFLSFAEVQPYEPKRRWSWQSETPRRILGAKRVSKNFRSAARYALTRGRWRPLNGGVGAQVGAQFMIERNFLWWKHRPYISFAALVRNYWEDSQLAGTLLDVLEEYGEGYAMNEGPRSMVSIFRNREGEDPDA